MNNVIDGRSLIGSNFDPWNFKCEEIDVPKYINDLYVDVYSDRFENTDNNPNALIRIKPRDIDPNLKFDEHSEDGYTEYKGYYPDSPKVEIAENNLSFVDDSGYPLSEEEFMKIAGVDESEIENLKSAAISYAKNYLEDWIANNYNDYFEQ